MGDSDSLLFKGRTFHPDELTLVRELVAIGADRSRQALAKILCQQLNWRRPNGKPKVWEAQDLLVALEKAGHLRLPPLRACGRPRGSRTAVPCTGRAEPQPVLRGTVRDVAPITLRLVATPEDRRLWRELIERYHPLGHRVPFGAHLRWLVEVARPAATVVGCIQLSSPAWKMEARDRWIGWSLALRRQNLQRIVNHSRFLILPWIQVRNLASATLAQMARVLPAAWGRAYGVEPVLLETLVEQAQLGTCYRAANWIALGETTGRGRMDRHHCREGLAPKHLFVYPLDRHAREILRGQR